VLTSITQLMEIVESVVAIALIWILRDLVMAGSSKSSVKDERVPEVVLVVLNVYHFGFHPKYKKLQIPSHLLDIGRQS